ncbi:MAG: hypothetical protein JWP69_2259 [Flaviaesturariibacter sp.]|nr:hypothetical protein [Flaviaesturariibacter sp.]
MKKILLALLLFGCVSLASAQEDKEKTPGLKSFAAVKWNPTSLMAGKLSLFGEYNFKNKRSVTVGIGIPVEKTFNFDIDEKDSELKTKTTSAMVGYRLYMGKKTMSGFYFEPYLKYTKNEMGTVLKDVQLEGQTADFLLTSKYSGVGGGFQLGAQAIIAKRVTLDFLILGLEGSSAKHTMELKDIKSSIPWDMLDEQKAEQEIKDITNDIPLIGKKIEVDANMSNKTVTTEYKGFLPGYRGGITIGFRF